MTSTHPRSHVHSQGSGRTGVDAGSRRSILTTVFALDRAFAATSAAVLTIGGFWLADLLDWPGWVVTAIGVGLAPYAYLLHVIVRDGLHRSTLARLTAVGDAGWVVGSAALLLGRPQATSTVGAWIIAIVALVVADIGMTKVYGWRQR
jgi:hypothetical protein